MISFDDGFCGDSEFLTEFEVVFSIDNECYFFIILLFSFLYCVFDKRERKLMRSGFSFCFFMVFLFEDLINPFADRNIQSSRNAVAIDEFGTDALCVRENFSVLHMFLNGLIGEESFCRREFFAISEQGIFFDLIRIFDFFY